MLTETPTDEKLHPLTIEFCKERERAIEGRRKLTAVWQKAREQYSGIDEINRSRMQSEGAETLDGPITTMGSSDREERSTVFVNITRPYTDAGTARIADILLPTSRLPFAIEPTPLSELGVVNEVLAKYPESTQALQHVPELQVRLARDDEANKVAVEGAETLIKDWLKECDWTGQLRQQIQEAGQVGVGIIKGPFSKKQELSEDIKRFINVLPLVYPDNPDTVVLIIEEINQRLQYAPVSECVRAENCFPDFPNCGTNIQNGKFFFEKVPDVSERQLWELMEDETYFAEQIQACLDEGPLNEKGEPKNKGQSKKHSFDLWIRTGDVSVSMLKDGDEEEDGKKEAPAFMHTTICNKRIIKIGEPMLKKKVFPYWPLTWQPREGSWDGVGIVEVIETPQRGLNASVRALMDNMGFAVGPQILFLQDRIEPVEGEPHKLHAYKWWKVLKDGLPGVDAMEDAKKAISLLEFPSYLNDIMPIIQLWLKLAEDTTGLPLLLQGQPSSPAVGVSNQLMNNSVTNLRRIIRECDDKVIEPQIQCYYDWTQLYGSDSVKGDAKVAALGSTVLLQRELQQQALLQLIDRSVQPVFGISPSKTIDAFLEGQQIDPESLKLTDEERQQLETAAEKPDPKVEVAQLETAATKYVADMRAEMEKLELALKAQQTKVDYLKAVEIADTQVAGSVALEGMKQEVEKEDKSPQLAAVSNKPPEEVKPINQDIDAQLDALGFVS